MWTKQSQPEPPSPSPAPWQPPSSPVNTATAARPTSPAARNVACLGATLEVSGQLSGQEDLQIDGKVEGPISLEGQRLTVGRTGKLISEVTAREVIVYGKITGNVRARDRVEIKKDGEVIGDITTTRISVEDGAYFKGRIEIERAKTPMVSEFEHEAVPVGVDAN